MRAFLFALTVAGFTCAAGAADDIVVSAEQIRSLGIETVAVAVSATHELTGLPGQVVVPTHQVRVVSVPLPALVESIFVASQQAVRKGQPLARLQSPGLADLQHTYLQAVTQLALAKANLEREEELDREGVIARSRLLATRAHHAEVSADLAERTQALRLAGMSDAGLAQLRSGRAVGTAIELAAPIDGVVLEQSASVGQRLEAMTPLMRVARLDPLWVELQLPASRTAEVSVGTAISVPSAGASGRIIALGRSINPANQTVLVRAEISRGAAQLRPGQFVEATVAVSGSPGQLTIPAAALVRHQGRPVVFLRTPTGFRALPIRLVAEGERSHTVTGALKDGDRIAVKSTSALKARLSGIGAD